MMRHGLLRGLGPARTFVPTAKRTFASTPRTAAEVEITIDGKKVTIERGAALIQACEKAGLTIPRYCYHVCVPCTAAAAAAAATPAPPPRARQCGCYVADSVASPLLLSNLCM